MINLSRPDVIQNVSCLNMRACNVCFYLQHPAPIACRYFYIIWVCSSSSFNSILSHSPFIIQFLSMTCPCCVPYSVPFFTYCLCRFLGRRDDIVQTPLPPSNSLFLLLSPSLLPPPSFELSAFVSFAAAVQ